MKTEKLESRRPALSRGLRIASLVLWGSAVAGSFGLVSLAFGQSVEGGKAAEAKAAGPVGAKSAEGQFEAPPREALEKVKWIPQRVVDSLEVLRERKQRTEAAPEKDEAILGLQNNDDAANARIAAVLGRLPASDDEVDWDATLTWLLPGTPSTCNPLLQSSQYEAMIISILDAGIFGFDQDLAPLADADVVKEWSTSEDRLMDRVVLRDDLTWSDGKPVTAHDVEFSFRVIRDPKVYIPALRTSVDSLRGVKAYDDRTVVYFHREALATNVWSVNFGIIPKHAFEPTLAADPSMVKSAENARLNRDGRLSSGPYRLVSWKEGDEVVIERRPEWFERDGKPIRRRPHFKAIRFRIIPERNSAMLAFKKGELDAIELTVDQWAGQTGGADFFSRATKVHGEEWSTLFIAWNLKPEPDVPFFKEAKVREALSLAFPHEEFISRVGLGLYPPASAPFHPRAWFGDPSLPVQKQDLRRAKSLLSEAGWKDTDGDSVLDFTMSGTKIPFRFTLLIPGGSPIYPKMAALYQSNLRKLGIVCDSKELDFAALQAQCKSHQFQAATFGSATGADPDTARNLWTTEAIQNGRNYAGYSSPEVDRLFDAGRREFDREKRGAIYREINRRIAADHPYTFLAYRPTLYALARDLRGFNFSPRGPYLFSGGIDGLWKRKKA